MFKEYSQYVQQAFQHPQMKNDANGIDSMINAIIATPRYDESNPGKTLVVWRNKISPYGRQPFIGPDDADEILACPDGSMIEEITSCVNKGLLMNPNTSEEILYNIKRRS